MSGFSHRLTDRASACRVVSEQVVATRHYRQGRQNRKYVEILFIDELGEESSIDIHDLEDSYTADALNLIQANGAAESTEVQFFRGHASQIRIGSFRFHAVEAPGRNGLGILPFILVIPTLIVGWAILSLLHTIVRRTQT